MSCALPSTMAMAPSWQAAAQAPQPLHLLSSISMIRRFMFGPPVAFLRSLYYTKGNKSVEFSTKEDFL